MVEIEVIEVREAPLFQAARIGDIVTIMTPRGSTRKGRVVMKFDTHLVLNGGGAHGTPLIADDSNTWHVKAKG
jgi:hypothetical protein